MSTNVLLVDDDPSIAPAVRFVLSRSDMDIEFQSVSGGPECLGVLREGFSGLIFMDVMMPGMDGWETIEAILDEDLLGDSVISMLTAVDDPPTDSDRLASAVINYIRKPFTREQLEEAVVDAMMMCGAGDEGGL